MGFEIGLIYATILSLASSFLATLIATPRIAEFNKRRGIVGVDYHKPGRPEIPEMGGLSMLIGLSISSMVILVLYPSSFWYTLSFILTVLSVGCVGVVDDLLGLGARVKPLLTFIAGLVPVLLNIPAYPKIYEGYLSVPFGRIRITILYNLLLPIGIAVSSNTMNMCDPVNGVMAGSSIIISLTLLLASLFTDRFYASPYMASILGCALAFYIYNRYPARVFPGDTGTLSLGAAIAYASVIGRLEFIALIAMLTQILNALFTLISLGGLIERRSISERPVRVLDDGRIVASVNPQAPITLTRMFTASRPMSEREVAYSFFILTSFSCILALITIPLIPR
ncbi:MAG: hypothetical protein QW695_06365 [Candidatus Bathyarchaeia archaeon]